MRQLMILRDVAACLAVASQLAHFVLAAAAIASPSSRAPGQLVGLAASATCVLLCAFLSLTLFARSRKETPGHDAPLLSGVGLQICSLPVLFVGATSSAAGVLFVTSLHVTVCAVYPAGPAIALVTCGAAAQAALLGATGRGPYALAVGCAAGLGVLGKLAIGFLLADWRRQYAMADQARYAATEFAVANLKMQSSLSVSESSGVLKERVRLAQEIHDTVGHALTGILIQLRTARELAKRDADRAIPVIVELEDMVRGALEDVRREVRAIRERKPVELSWQAQWRLLCVRFADCTGTRVQLSLPEEELHMPESIGSTITKVVQESLTNSIRHGRASLVDVALRVKHEQRKYLLRVSDNGVGADRVRIGVGLTGIRDRVAALGGEVAWQTLPQRGFDVGVVIPFAEEAPK